MQISANPTYTRLDLSGADTFKGVSKRLNIKTVYVDATVPKHYTHELNSRAINFETVAYLLEDATVLKGVSEIASNSAFWSKNIENVVQAKSGKITPNSDNIPFSLIYDRTEDTLGEMGLSTSKQGVMVVTMLMTDLLNKLGLVGSKNTIKIFDTQSDMFITRSSLQQELIKDRVRYALDLINFDGVEVGGLKSISIHGIVDKFEASMQSFVMALDGLKAIPQEIETVVTLVRAYLTKDFLNIPETELFYFEQPEFLEVATNLSFVEMAIKSNHVKPVGNSNYWARCLSKVVSGLKSSPRYAIVELNALKEYFSLSTVEDTRGFRKGVILSKNLKEDQPLEIARVMPSSKQFTRLIKDQTAESAFATTYMLAKKMDSTVIHSYAHNMFSHMAHEEFNLFVCNIGVADLELHYIACMLSDSLELDLTKYEEQGKLGFVYVIDTTDSQISDSAPTTWGAMKVTLPDYALLYADEYQGSKFISFKEGLITDTKNIQFDNITEAFGEELGIGWSSFMTYGGERIVTEWHIDELAGLVNLDDTFMIQPLIGQKLYESLFSLHDMIVKISAEEDPKGRSAMNANLALINLMKDFIQSPDVDNLLGTAISQLWNARKSVSGESKFSRSLLARDHVRSEIKIRLGLYLLHKLGFLNIDQVKDMAKEFKRAGAYELYQA